ncbi:hypothetical protein AB4Y89_11640 [Terriglobus sp. 2YAB30_2]|uniref:hypothetical protein n=1 Tax=Terriglobus sp. 2YAB30_2 TaxID=3233023 RepID=UPI003F947193
MKKKNEENQSAKSLEESLEALFGREADLTDAELDEELAACGIDPAKLQADVHKQLFDYANHHYRTLDKAVPEDLEKTLRALRPPNATDKAKAVIRSAEDLVGSFLDTAKAKSSELVRNVLPTQARQPQFAFRNKKELSAADKALLESEQEDVDSSEG